MRGKLKFQADSATSLGQRLLAGGAHLDHDRGQRNRICQFHAVLPESPYGRQLSEAASFFMDYGELNQSGSR